MSSGFEQRSTVRKELMDKTKSYGISKKVVLAAYQKVKANKGVAGVDGQSLAAFEVNLKDISQTYDPKIRGWANYYGRFYKSDMYSIYYHLNHALIRWAMRKYKKLRTHKRRACNWLARIARQEPELFVHWQMGIIPAGDG
jgi:hypothetical protein